MKAKKAVFEQEGRSSKRRKKSGLAGQLGRPEKENPAKEENIEPKEKSGATRSCRWLARRRKKDPELHETRSASKKIQRGLSERLKRKKKDPKGGAFRGLSKKEARKLQKTAHIQSMNTSKEYCYNSTFTLNRKKRGLRKGPKKKRKGHPA